MCKFDADQKDHLEKAATFRPHFPMQEGSADTARQYAEIIERKDRHIATLQMQLITANDEVERQARVIQRLHEAVEKLK